MPKNWIKCKDEMPSAEYALREVWVYDDTHPENQPMIAVVFVDTLRSGVGFSIDGIGSVTSSTSHWMEVDVPSPPAAQ